MQAFFQPIMSQLATMERKKGSSLPRHSHRSIGPSLSSRCKRLAFTMLPARGSANDEDNGRR